MKSLFIHFFLWLNLININAQSKKVLIFSDSGSSVSDAILIIDNSPKYISDSIGLVTINNIDFDKEITIRHLNFETKRFTKWNLRDTLFLNERKYTLNEVELKSKRKKSKTLQLFPTKNISNSLPKNFGKSSSISQNVEIAVFFPNQDSTKTKIIKKILVPTNDYKVIETLQSNKRSKRKNAKYSPFKINLYTVDSVIGIPKDKKFEEYFVIKCDVDENYAVLELNEDEEFEFTKDGFFVVIKNLTIEEYEELGYYFAPGIDQIGVSKNNKFLPYFRYLYQAEDAKWKKKEYLINRKNIYNIGIEFKEIK
ncbi:hypothetical protein ACFSX9_01215 [Flavobacterium ardleyense]|uniref:Uncharacterized protein n=1 Tax=Flavobacterium ardleyense TaxID=2038737 RepID=A0ABW5Z440_9FLAO